MKKFLIVYCSILFFFGISATGFCADVAKIGVIDFQKILKESSAGKIAQKQINKKGEGLQEKLKAMKDNIEELNLSLEREALVMSKEKRTEKQREIRIKVNDFKQKQLEYKNEFQQMEAQIVNKIQKEVFDIAQSFGKDQGFLLIIEKQAAGVIYNPDSIDITDKVIENYNKTMSKSN